ncbi:MAG: hypothetical protein FJX47_09145 [Alphaproteobacteria bacterium]|nr:hypothetical protein [Alphaproteobacteria bacterium]
MSEMLPSVVSTGLVSKVLEKIKSAATPDRFTQDHLSSVLNMKGGSAKSLIPFLKRIGFLGSDGAPTEIYKSFRNKTTEGQAAAKALQHGYRPLFNKNEKAHELNDADLKGLIVEITGKEPNSRTVQAILASFKAIKNVASFNSQNSEDSINNEKKNKPPKSDAGGGTGSQEKPDFPLGLSYTINLNIPATSDSVILNAIFKSIKENLMK